MADSKFEHHSEKWWSDKHITTALVSNYGGIRSGTQKSGQTSHEANIQNSSILHDFPAQLMIIQEHDARIFEWNDFSNFHKVEGLYKNDLGPMPEWDADLRAEEAAAAA